VSAPESYRFGPFCLDVARRQLRRDSAAIGLPPKAFDILVCLVRNRSRVVPKQELLDAVWGDTAVTENTLTQRIKEIRGALDDDPQEPRCIRTVSRVGYQFVAEIVADMEEAPRPPDPTSGAEVPPLTAVPESPAESPAALSISDVRKGPPTRFWRRLGYVAAVAILAATGALAWLHRAGNAVPADRPGRIESIAVLPLENLSRDAEQEYFADGMTDELIKELAGIQSLRVISRTSALRFKGSTKSLREIGAELNVDAIVEGSVLRAGQQARITLKLVEVATDRTLLAESFARELQDILALQGQIAGAVAEQVRATVAPDEQARAIRRVVPEAYDHYLRGRSSWNRRTPEGVGQAIQSFQRAVHADPSFAAAWAGIADCYIVFSGALLGLSPNEAYPKAREAAERALALEETLAEAHTSLASVKSDYDWDWAGAEAEYTRALAINPNYVTARQWYGEFLYFRGRGAESLAQLERARRLDPLSPVVNNSLAISLLMAGRYDDALAQAQKTIALDTSFGGAHLTLGQVYLRKSMYDEALAAMKRSVALSHGLSRPVAWLAHAYAAAGQPLEARRSLDQLEGLSKEAPVSPYDVALVHAALGDREQTFTWLERAYEKRASDLIQLPVDRRFDDVRSDRRFADLLRRIGLQPRS
jgi:TolB-like protein/DNA-binding winged helix-turn-helix (wHTH) protein/Tfp pilus assembly protein PilF